MPLKKETKPDYIKLATKNPKNTYANVKLRARSLCVIVANVPKFDIVEIEFELLSRSILN